MNLPRKLVVIQALRVRRERTATLALRRSERVVRDIEQQRLENERTIAGIEQAQRKVYDDLPESMTRAHLYALKRTESFLEHQLIEKTVNARELAIRLRDAADARQQAKLRVGHTHRRVMKIDHVRKRCNVRVLAQMHTQEEHEIEEIILEN